MSSVILGEWTHRRGDPGGSRAVPAEIDRPRPAIAWSWRPEHGGRVDQVRVVGQNVIVATMMPRDANAAGWEHAVLYALDARTGVEVARRVLPDPVPVAAIVVDSGLVHVVATRKGEPIFWYALSPLDLAPHHRRIVGLQVLTRHDDVLDAWAAPDGGLWLELDSAIDTEGRHALAYVFTDAGGATREVSSHEEDIESDGAAPARDACAGGHELFTPVDGKWTGGDAPQPPALTRLDPRGGNGPDGAWVSATVVGPRAQIHAIGGEGVVCAVAAAEDPDKPERARVEVFAVDRSSGVVRWRAQADRVAIKPQLGDAARIARRPNGELLFQSLGPDGAPRTPLVCARPDGRLDEILLGARGRWILDAALGDLVLAHREDDDGDVQVGGFAIDHEGRLLGRRAVTRWSIGAGDLGGGTTVYAGAGAVVVRGTRAVCAVHL
jgi:hypothetical protein